MSDGTYSHFRPETGVEVPTEVDGKYKFSPLRVSYAPVTRKLLVLTKICIQTVLKKMSVFSFFLYETVSVKLTLDEVIRQKRILPIFKTSQHLPLKTVPNGYELRLVPRNLSSPHRKN